MTFALPWRLYNTSDFGMKGAIAVRKPSRTKRRHCPLSGRKGAGKGKVYLRGPARINKRSSSIKRAIFLITRLRCPVERAVEELDGDCFSRPDLCDLFRQDDQAVCPDH